MGFIVFWNGLTHLTNPSKTWPGRVTQHRRRKAVQPRNWTRTVSLYPQNSRGRAGWKFAREARQAGRGETCAATFGFDRSRGACLLLGIATVVKRGAFDVTVEVRDERQFVAVIKRAGPFKQFTPRDRHHLVSRVEVGDFDTEGDALDYALFSIDNGDWVV
jgi:hypothetical protein